MEKQLKELTEGGGHNISKNQNPEQLDILRLTMERDQLKWSHEK